MTDLAHRYGTPSATRRKVLVALLVVLVGAALSWLVWAMLVHGRPLAQSQLTGYRVLDPGRVEASFTVVRRDADVVATCQVRALAPDHGVVGETTVPVGPGGPTVSTHTAAFRTEREATAVDVIGCTAPGQPQPR